METNKSTHESYSIELFAPIMKQNESYIAVLSDTSVDRDGERVGKSALVKISERPGYLAALIDHENKVLNQIAQWKNVRLETIDGHDALVAEPHFFKSNPKAQIIKGMLDEGAEIGISIGAIVKQWENQKVNGDSVRTFTELELLEASFVAIPANKHGKAMAVAKKYTPNTVKQMEKEFTQKDVDSQIEKKVSEITADFKKQLESKDNELSELSKKLSDSEKALDEKEEEKKKVEADKADTEKKLTETETALETAKKLAIEKQKFGDEGNNGEELSDEDVTKAISEGKIPFIKY